MTTKDAVEKTVRDIRRKTRKQYSAEEKIRIVLEGLRGEESIAALCRREGIAESLYYSWSKEFLEAGKKRLPGDTARQANTGEVKALRAEARDLKEAPTQKKHDRGWGRRRMRYSASEKLEIIRPVEKSHLPVRRALDKLGIPSTTVLSLVRHYQALGETGLADRTSGPGRVWNRIPDVGPRADRGTGPERARTELPGIGGAVHRHPGLLRLGSPGLAASQGP
ncbi:transposase-like protein [Varunaivibrio sulfuroxidans]|uniref:Transposase-like protein n=1 Tax=Varunaivibrio sulfuroxidans TaxID=1773489 RepID=A0A4R3JC95_9PROT|nr:transposase-like protein [Varunaivibrio sulfuroxidans]